MPLGQNLLQLTMKPFGNPLQLTMKPMHHCHVCSIASLTNQQMLTAELFNILNKCTTFCIFNPMCQWHLQVFILIPVFQRKKIYLQVFFSWEQNLLERLHVAGLLLILWLLLDKVLNLKKMFASIAYFTCTVWVVG